MADTAPRKSDKETHNSIVYPQLRISSSRRKRILLMTLGVISMILGLIGIVVPLLPTTPFLLLSSWCFVRSSEKFSRLLYSNSVLGPYLLNYQAGHGITLKNKIYSLVFMWIFLGISAAVGRQLIWLPYLLLFIGAGVSYHILRFKTLKDPSK